MQFVRQTQKGTTSHHRKSIAHQRTYGLLFGVQEKQQFLTRDPVLLLPLHPPVKSQSCVTPGNPQRAKLFLEERIPQSIVLPPANKSSSLGRRNKCSSVIPFKKKSPKIQSNSLKRKTKAKHNHATGNSKGQ